MSVARSGQVVSKAALPVVTRLKSLTSPSRLAPDGSRVIATAFGGDALSALLREMNETVLGRTLRFESDAGAQLSLEVSGRRVLRVTAASGLPGAEALMDTPTLEDEHKDDLLKLFQATAAPQHDLRVMSSPMTSSFDGLSVGLPVALLADLLLLDLNPDPAAERPAATPSGADLSGRPLRSIRPVVVEPVARAEPEPAPAPAPSPAAAPAPVAVANAADGPGLGRIAGSLGGLSMAWIVAGGTDDGAADGVDEMVDHLRGFLDDEGPSIRRQLDLMSADPGGPVCILLGAALVEGNSILCARLGDGLLLALIDGDATTHVLAAWMAAVG